MRRKRCLCGWILTLAVSVALGEPGPWRSLFNGCDLTGWQALGSAVWRVEDGVLVGTQDGDPRRSGLLATTAVFGDVEVELSFQIDEHGKYNSGVHLRNRPGSRRRTGYQVNIGRAAAGEYSGGVFTDRWLARGDAWDRVRRPRAWNTLRIRARGAHLTVTLNGVCVADVYDPAPESAWLEPGALALQTYGAEGHAGWVRFRAIRARALR